MPSLISSRQIAGHPTTFAILCASVVLPEPGGPLITTSVGLDLTPRAYFKLGVELGVELGRAISQGYEGVAAVTRERARRQFRTPDSGGRCTSQADSPTSVVPPDRSMIRNMPGTILLRKTG